MVSNETINAAVNVENQREINAGVPDVNVRVNHSLNAPAIVEHGTTNVTIKKVIPGGCQWWK